MTGLYYCGYLICYIEHFEINPLRSRGQFQLCLIFRPTTNSSLLYKWSTTVHLNRYGSPDCPAASGVVQSPDERPEELYTPREQFTEVSQYDQEHGDPEDGVDDGDSSSGVCARRDVPVPCNKIHRFNSLSIINRMFNRFQALVAPEWNRK